MKKIIVFILFFFLFLGGVDALVCYYTGSSYNIRVQINHDGSTFGNVFVWSRKVNSDYNIVQFSGLPKEENTIDLLWKVYFSESAINKINSIECPEVAYYENKSSDGICFQGVLDGDFCKSKDSNFFKIGGVKEITYDSVDEYPETDTPGTENPGTENPGAENPGAENPGAENPGAETPGTENPGAETPGELLDLDASFCSHSGTLRTFRILGICVIILKILIPIILIIVGSLELGKAVIASDDKAISLAITSITKKAIAAIIIFFIPSIIKFAFSLVSNFSNTAENFKDCSTCVNDVEKCDILIEAAKSAGK